MSWFACATRRPIMVNFSGSLTPNRGLLLHHQVGTGSLFNFFNNPAAEVSAHFWVGKSGQIEQYVDTSAKAWHATSLNDTYCGVETEGCADSPHAEPMTEAMIDALSRLYAEGTKVHGWPNALAEDDGQRGFGYHRMGGHNQTACPCDVRKNTRATILGKAFGGQLPNTPPGSSTSTPSTPAPPSGDAPPWPGRYLKHPPVMTGEDVRTWQGQMDARGWALAVDGAYGPDSAETCRMFQAEKGIDVDGIVGPDTWAATWNAPIT